MFGWDSDVTRARLWAQTLIRANQGLQASFDTPEAIPTDELRERLRKTLPLSHEFIEAAHKATRVRRAKDYGKFAFAGAWAALLAWVVWQTFRG